LVEYIAPFYFGVLMKGEDGVMRFVSGGHILKDDEKVDEN
jgi:hypothetical protein